MDAAILILQILILLGLGAASLLLKSFLPKYLEEKGKNLATKEDIEEITQKVESVKAEISRSQSVFQAKYRLKHDACLEALKMVDAHFSHTLQDPDGQSIVKQFASTEHARECHNKLILACENTEILAVFDEIMFGPKNTDGQTTPPTDLLNRFRNLIRHELGFGGDIELDRDRAWFGKVGCEPRRESEEAE